MTNKRGFSRLMLAGLLTLAVSVFGYGQQTSRAPAIMVDTPTITLTTATADTTATPSTGAHTAIVQFRFGTVVGTYTTCTVQAKTTLDGTNYLNLSTAAPITVTTGTATAWTVTAKGPTSGNTSTPSTTTADGFGQLTKYTVACSGAYGTSAPVTVSTTYSPDVLGGASGGGGGAITVADGDDLALGAIADAAATQGSTGSISAKLRTITGQLNTLNAAIAAAAVTDPCAGTLPTIKRYISVNTSQDKSQVKATAGTLCAIQARNANASTDAFLKCTNLTAANTTPGSSAVYYDMIVPKGGGYVNAIIHAPFSVALTCYLVTGKADSDATAVAADDVSYFLLYQ